MRASSAQTMRMHLVVCCQAVADRQLLSGLPTKKENDAAQKGKKRYRANEGDCQVQGRITAEHGHQKPAHGDGQGCTCQYYIPVPPAVA